MQQTGSKDMAKNGDMVKIENHCNKIVRLGYFFSYFLSMKCTNVKKVLAGKFKSSSQAEHKHQAKTQNLNTWKGEVFNN